MDEISNYDYPASIRDQLCRCRGCNEPMYCLYDPQLRYYCKWCARKKRIKNDDNLLKISFYIISSK